VENLVKWVKGNFLPGRTFADDADLAQQSLAWEQAKSTQVCQAHGRRPVELLPQEQAAFGPLTTTAATYGLYRVATVNRESLVRVEGNQYSVPVGHLGHAVDVRLLQEEVRISRDGVALARHPRLTGTGQRRRHHLHESVLQRAVRTAALRAGIAERVRCHTVRHSFTTHLLEDGHDIRTVQELLGHHDVSPTMIDTHVLNRGPGAVRSPADRMFGV
jgi:hypothetical protein